MKKLFESYELNIRPYSLHHNHYVVNFNGWQGAVVAVRKNKIRCLWIRIIQVQRICLMKLQEGNLLHITQFISNDGGNGVVNLQRTWTK